MKKIMLHRVSFFAFTFLLLSVIVIGLNLINRQYSVLKTPPHTVNTFAMGNFDDYHQYMMILRFGRQGRLLYHNAYSEEDIPDVFLQPFYTISGLLSRPFAVSVYDLYFVLHILSLALLFYCVFRLIKTVFPGRALRLLSVLFFFSATGWWWLASLHPLLIQRHELQYANFDIFFKFFVIPPHHNVAIALVIACILTLTEAKRRSYPLFACICFILMNFIHPYIMYIFWIILTVNTVIAIVQAKTVRTPESAALFWISAGVAPFVAYNIYIHGFVLRWGIGNAGILSYLPRAESLYSYVQALGPMFFLAIPALFVRKSYVHPAIRLLLLWAFVPMVLFFLPDFHIPFNTWRLFQIYQQLPLALVAAYSVSLCFAHARKHALVLTIIGIISFLYGGISLGTFLYGYIKSPPTGYINLYIPESVVRAYAFLDQHTPNHSVVIAGGLISNMLPSYAHNHVVIGHNGDNRNFLAKQKDIGLFLGNGTPKGAVREFLDRYHAEYIIFGVDAPAFEYTRYADLPFLKEIYARDGIQIVQVLAR